MSGSPLPGPSQTRTLNRHYFKFNHTLKLIPTAYTSVRASPTLQLHMHDATPNKTDELHFIGLHSYNRIW